MFPLNWYAKINKQGGGEGGVRISFKNEKSLLKKNIKRWTYPTCMGILHHVYILLSPRTNKCVVCYVYNMELCVPASTTGH